MYALLLIIRNAIIHFVYARVLKHVFFHIDPEKVHDRIVKNGDLLGKSVVTRAVTCLAFGYHHPTLEQEILGMRFANPVGLAAGFDKDAQLTGILPSVGFGFVEVGSITGEPCEGNPKPRLWRLPHTRALVVHYGLKNKGSKVLAERLRGRTFGFPVGISIAKTNCKATADRDVGIADYAKAYAAFADIGAYTTVNISCPNAFGGQPFTSSEDLDALLFTLRRIPSDKPMFLKMPPDITSEQVDAIIEVAREHGVAGFICVNLTKDRSRLRIDGRDTLPEQGSVSGKPVEDLSNKQIAHIHRRTRGEFVIIGCGGIFSAKDAYKKILVGASLVQLITGMIYEGPQLISAINSGLVGLLRKDGYGSVAEAVGKG